MITCVLSLGTTVYGIPFTPWGKKKILYTSKFLQKSTLKIFTQFFMEIIKPQNPIWSISYTKNKYNKNRDEKRTVITRARSSESQAELVLNENGLPINASEISKKYLEISDPPLSLGGSERKQHLTINYWSFKDNALICYHLFSENIFICYRIHSSRKRNLNKKLWTHSKYILLNNSFSIINCDYVRKKCN